jgi:hypothetical protein
VFSVRTARAAAKSDEFTAHRDATHQLTSARQAGDHQRAKGLSRASQVITPNLVRIVERRMNLAMIAAKENSELLEELLLIHIAPTSKAEITRGHKNFKEFVKKKRTPVSKEQLEKGIVTPQD